MPTSVELSRLLENAFLSVDRLSAETLLREAVADGGRDSIGNAIATALERIGTAWETGDVALAQIYMASRIAADLVDQLIPEVGPLRTGMPRMAVAVLEDYHMLGKQIVKATLRAAGFEPLDFGRVTVEQLVERAKAESVALLLVSTLMLRSALRVKTLRELCDRELPGARIIVGGAPFRFDPGLWREVGADAVAATAGEVTPLVLRFAGEVR